MVLIPTNGGRFVKVDADDAARVSQHRWTSFAAKRRSGRIVYYATCSRIGYSLHQFILRSDRLIDHKNGDGLDNRKCNLRHCTRSENNVNQAGRTDTGFKGVYRRTGKRGVTRYVAMMPQRSAVRRFKSKTFDTVEEAARAYDAAALNGGASLRG
jgi:hypothetical protein